MGASCWCSRLARRTCGICPYCDVGHGIHVGNGILGLQWDKSWDWPPWWESLLELSDVFFERSSSVFASSSFAWNSISRPPFFDFHASYWWGCKLFLLTLLRTLHG